MQFLTTLRNKKWMGKARLRGILFCLFVGLGSWGCSAGPDASGTPFVPMCATSGGCPGQLACSNELYLCYDSSPAEVVVAAELIPPAGSGLVTDHRSSVSFHGENQFNATLSPALKVHGVVQEIDNPLSSIPARIVAETPGDIPGSMLRTEVFAIEGLNENNASFTLNVIAGREYLLSIFPEDENRPPHMLTRTFQPGEDMLVLTLPQLEGPYSYPRISGSMLDETELDESGQPVALANIQVVATRVNTEEQGEEEDVFLSYMSTISKTDSKLGLFEIRVPALPAHYQLRIESVGEPGSKVVPKTKTDTETFGIEISGEYGEHINLGPILLEPLPTVPAVIHVNSVDENGEEVPVAGAALTLTNSLSPESSFTMSVLSASEPAGTWQGNVLQGTYTVDVIPPQNSPYARRKKTMVIDSANPLHDIPLERRTRLQGEVKGWDHELVSGALVLAVNKSLDTYALPQQAQTDEFGVFTLWLDPGPHAFVVIPPPSAPYPRLIIDQEEISGEEMAVSLLLPVPHIVQGVVTNAEGEPAPEVTVVFHQLSHTDDPAHTVSSFGDIRDILGEGITDDYGHYSLLIPVSKPDTE